jgi:hypothetical protein
MSFRSACLHAAVLATTLVVAREAGAQALPDTPPALVPKQPSDTEKEQARSLAREGVKLYDAGKLEEAISQFHRANALYPLPQGALYIARCHARLGHLVRARELYSALVSTVLPAGASQNARDAHAAAEAELTALRPRLPTLTIGLAGSPSEGIEILLDGAVVPAAALAGKEVDPGAHTVGGRATGRVVTSRSVTLAEGEHVRIELEVKSTPPSAAGSDKAILPKPTGGPPGGGVQTPRRANTGSGARSSPLRTAGFMTVGAGVVGLAVGAVAGGLAIAKKDALHQVPGCADRRCPDSEARNVGEYYDLVMLSSVGFMAGAVALAAGTALIVIAPKLEPSRTSLRWTPWIGAGSLGIRGAF